VNIKGQQRNVQQHFVTAAYLAGFTPTANRDSQLWVYERNSEKNFRLIPDEAAKRRNYYSIPQQDGGFNDIVDTMLTALEGQAMPSLRKLLLKDYELSEFERALLGYLIAFQEFRTPWARASFQKMELHLAQHMMRMATQAPDLSATLFPERVTIIAPVLTLSEWCFDKSSEGSLHSSL
jgi:Protein of unknown function (DUF4238)